MSSYRLKMILASLFTGGLCLSSVLAAPDWWTTRGVVDANDDPKDFGAVNVGQFKWMVTNAYDELERMLPDGAGSTLDAFVSGLSSSNNSAALNHGQLKYVAEMFYDRLITESYTNAYPWTTTDSDDENYGMVNNGQLKWLFEFDPGQMDSDSDGLSNATESNSGIFNGPTDPGSDLDDSDSDNDGVDDGQEVANRTDPNNADTTAPIVRIDYPTHMQVIRWVP